MNSLAWGLRIIQKKKKKQTVLENTLLHSLARTAGIESYDQCYSDTKLDNSSSLGLIKENSMKQ